MEKRNLYCKKCGHKFEEGENTCPVCGAEPVTGEQIRERPINAAGAYHDPYANADPNMSKRKFAGSEYLKWEIKKNLLSAVIIGYICAAINLAVGIMTQDVISIIIAVVLVLLTLGIHILKSMSCAIIYLALAIINVLATLVMYHKFGGWLIFIGGATAVWAIGRLNSEYEGFRTAMKDRREKYNVLLTWQ